jgi:XTP/dITP diphosphohydrolase
MTLYLASNNAHKLDEIRQALPGLDIHLPKHKGIDFDFEEDADTFMGNSTGKAFALWSILKSPVIADDSGLCVDALEGRPGVLSARYGSIDGITTLSSSDRNQRLLKEMEGITVRSCRFVCCMSLVLSAERFFVVQETCEGELLKTPRGLGGFGYDPVVYLPELGKTVAELTVDEKNRVSHRGRAMARLSTVIGSFASLP